MALILKKDFEDWLENPVTKQLRQKLREDVENMQVMLMDVGHDDLDRLQAHCQAAIKLLGITYEDLV
jgi:hypothetical protein